MDLMTSSLHGAVLCLAVLGLTSAGDFTVTFRVKEDVVLPCKAPKSSGLRVLEWEKDGLGQDYVFHFRDGSLSENFQNVLYRGRVKLEDSKMTDGNMGIILSNTTLTDEGKYTCHVVLDTDTTHTIHLRVEDPPNLGLMVGLPVGLVAATALAIAGFLYVCKRKNGSTL